MLNKINEKRKRPSICFSYNAFFSARFLLSRVGTLSPPLGPCPSSASLNRLTNIPLSWPTDIDCLFPVAALIGLDKMMGTRLLTLFRRRPLSPDDPRTKFEKDKKVFEKLQVEAEKMRDTLQQLVWLIWSISHVFLNFSSPNVNRKSMSMTTLITPPTASTSFTVSSPMLVLRESATYIISIR